LLLLDGVLFRAETLRSEKRWNDPTSKNMEILLALFYIALFVAIVFFGPLQEFLYKKKAE
jgi:hypothetical protein